MLKPLPSHVTEAAVMESLAENRVVEAYFAGLPDEEKGTAVTLQNILDFAESKPEYMQDPNMQILQDYFKGSRNANEYVIQDYSRTLRPDGSFEGNWEANLMVTTPGDGKEPGVYVAFRGTQKGEGHDNAEGMYMATTPQQRAAREYFDRLVKEHEDLFANSNVQVVGHSKGGNKAMFVTMTSRYGEYIDSCVALDGQGFSPEAIEYFQQDPTFESRRGKITLVAGKYDYVHALGLPIVAPENVYYVDTKPTHGADSFHSMHWSHYMFEQDENGNFTSTFGNVTEPAEFIGNLQDFFEDYCGLPQEQRRDSAHTLMLVLWGEESPDGANLDPHAIVTVCTLMEDPISAFKAISGAVLAAWPQIETIISILKAGKTIAEMLGVPLPTVSFGAMLKLGIVLFGAWAVYRIVAEYMEYKAEEKEEMIRQMAMNEASEHPEFYIDPDTLIQAASAGENGRIGSRIEDIQDMLRDLSRDSAPDRTLFWADVMAPGGGMFDMDEVRRLRTINDAINERKREIRALQENCRASIEQLEKLKMTLNGVLAYMSDTGNEFANIENSIVSKVHAWGDAAMGKK